MHYLNLRELESIEKCHDTQFYLVFATLGWVLNYIKKCLIKNN